jgi:hypothetical protein
MATDYSGEELLDFLNHAGDRGLMPAATAGAMAVASRRILEILSDEERADVRKLDSAAVIRRFGNKRAKDFNPSSLKEYGRRFQRAVEMFKQWREDPAAFSVPTRSTGAARKRAKTTSSNEVSREQTSAGESYSTIPAAGITASGFQTSFPIRPGTIVTILNLPADLTKTEADRLAQFVRMLALGS